MVENIIAREVCSYRTLLDYEKGRVKKLNIVNSDFLSIFIFALDKNR